MAMTVSEKLVALNVTFKKTPIQSIKWKWKSRFSANYPPITLSFQHQHTVVGYGLSETKIGQGTCDRNSLQFFSKLITVSAEALSLMQFTIAGSLHDVIRFGLILISCLSTRKAVRQSPSASISPSCSVYSDGEFWVCLKTKEALWMLYEYQ